MNSSKKRRSRNKKKPSPSPDSVSASASRSDPPKGEEATQQSLADGCGGDEDPKRALDWLSDAFSSVSVDEIESAYRETGGDPFKAAGILGTPLDDHGEGNSGAKGIRAGRKQKRIAAATGLVSDVIGKSYCGAGRRNREGANLQVKGGMNCADSVEEAEQLLFSVLGDESELNMTVVRDMLCQYGCNIEKALEVLLDSSSSSCHQLKETQHQNAGTPKAQYSGICPQTVSSDCSTNTISSFQQFFPQLKDTASDLAYHLDEPENIFKSYNRNHANLLDDSEVPVPAKSDSVITDLQQQVLESLFSIPKSPTYEPNRMDWKKVVQKMESFGLGLELFSLRADDNLPSDKEDTYQMFRSVSNEHWDMMRTYYQKAADAYSKGDRAYASYLSEKGKFHRDLARQAEDKASREIFEIKNKNMKNTVTIDLHGQHVKQAIEILKLHLLFFTYMPSVQYLKVITGCGADVVGKGKLKRAVLGLVEKEGVSCREENAGTLVLRLDAPKQYSFMECDSESE